MEFTYEVYTVVRKAIDRMYKEEMMTASMHFDYVRAVYDAYIHETTCPLSQSE